MLDGGGALPNSWARVFGEEMERKWSGTVSPTFDGHLSGWRLGLFAFICGVLVAAMKRPPQEP